MIKYGGKIDETFEFYMKKCQENAILIWKRTFNLIQMKFFEALTKVNQKKKNKHKNKKKMK